MKIAFGALTNMPSRLDMALRQSEIAGEMHYVRDPESATKGLNKLLGLMETEGADVGVLTHHDMSYRRVWLVQVESQLALLPESWIVAGLIGKDMQGRICGVFHDTRVPQIFNTSDIHVFPQAACCFDECCILVNLHKGFRFDEALGGFDLYGTLCVLQAWEMGGTAWIIDSGACQARLQTPAGELVVDIAYAQHHCTRPFSWFPDKDFEAWYKWLYERYEKIGKIDTTALGVPEEPRRFETSAAA